MRSVCFGLLFRFHQTHSAKISGKDSAINLIQNYGSQIKRHSQRLCVTLQQVSVFVAQCTTYSSIERMGLGISIHVCV